MGRQQRACGLKHRVNSHSLGFKLGSVLWPPIAAPQLCCLPLACTAFSAPTHPQNVRCSHHSKPSLWQQGMRRMGRQQPA